MTAPGRLNNRINILKPTTTQNSETGEETTTYQRYHRKVPADKVDASGGTTRRGEQVEATVKSVFTIRWIADIGAYWRVEINNQKHEGPVYEIVSILELDDKQMWMALHCSDVKE